MYTSQDGGSFQGGVPLVHPCLLQSHSPECYPALQSLQDKALTPWGSSPAPSGLASHPSAPCTAVLLPEPHHPFHTSGFCILFLCWGCFYIPWRTWDISYSFFKSEPRAASGNPSLIAPGRGLHFFSRAPATAALACEARTPIGPLWWAASKDGSQDPCLSAFLLCNALPLRVAGHTDTLLRIWQKLRMSLLRLVLKEHLMF